MIKTVLNSADIDCICQADEIEAFMIMVDKYLLATAICMRCDRAWHTQP